MSAVFGTDQAAKTPKRQSAKNLLGKILEPANQAEDTPDHGEKSSPPETHSGNHVHNVRNVHTNPQDRDDGPALDADPLGGATDPSADALDVAVDVVEDAIARCKESPEVLGGEEFRDAVSFIRTDAPGEWFRLRVALKAAKPSGVLLEDIDKQTRPDGDGDADDSSTADELVALVQGLAELFHAADGTCYAALKGDGPRRTYRMDTQACAQWASYAYYMDTASETRPGRAASEAAVRTARTVLTGIATHEGDERKVYLRAAKHGEAYLIDLGTDDWSAVEVSGTGWRIVARPPVHFWRPGTMRPLPLPVPGGDLSRLWNYANIPERDRPMVLAWLLEAWRPETPFAILELTGQQGTAKSGTQAKLRRCIDPNAVDLRAAPKSVEDLFVSAGANWCASLNNLSHLSAQVQDALCSLATGGGFAGRTLFTNVDETLVEAKRPVIINGIVPVVTAQDLTDRVIHIDLPELGAYRTETAIDADFEKDAPHIIGGLLDLFVKTLAALPGVALPRPPRMADYAALGEAMHRSQGNLDGSFVRLYLENRRESVARSLESSPVACAIRALVDEHQGQSSLVWTGTMKALLEILAHRRDGAEAWPRSPRGLGDALRRQRPALAQIGVNVQIAKAGRDGVHVTIERCEHCEHGEHGSSSRSPGGNFSGDAEDRV